MLSPRNDIGRFDPATNIAHEIGYAWGLKHEHQNPYFWSKETFEGYAPEGSSAVFGQFDCEALSDYDGAKRHVEHRDTVVFLNYLYKDERPIQEKRAQALVDMCRLQSFAQSFNFKGAIAFLPFVGMDADMDYGATTGARDDFDWDSVMLYSSGGGGIDVRVPSGPPPQGVGLAENPNDHRRNVLLTSDGNRFGYSQLLSTKDVEGIMKLYRTPSPSIQSVELPNNERFVFFTRFIETVKRTMGCGLGGGTED